MTYVPDHPSYQDWDAAPPPNQAPTTIVVAALRENARPVGFAPWPTSKAEKKSKTKRKQRRS